MEGDDHGEAYTVIVWGVGLSHEMPEVAGAEAVTDGRRQHVRCRYARSRRPAGV